MQIRISFRAPFTTAALTFFYCHQHRTHFFRTNNSNMSRFFWNTASERKHEHLLADKARHLLSFQVVWQEIKARHQDQARRNMIVDESDDESDTSSLSLSSCSDYDLDSTDFSVSSSSETTSSSEADSRLLFDSECSMESLMTRAVSSSMNNWIQAYTAINIPLEVQGIDWGRRLLCVDISEPEALRHFRFRKGDLIELLDQLWPRMEPYLTGTCDKVIVQQRYTAPFETGMLLLMYRMAHTTRIHPEMESYFGMRRSHIGFVIDTFSDALCSVAISYLSNPLLLSFRFPLYADSIHQKCGLLDCIWGFIDGTVRQTCRPKYFQKRNYSGHKRFHGLKFQSIVTPDGFYGHFYGPTNGNRHDSFMLGESGIMPVLAAYMEGIEGSYALYGDPAYPQSGLLFGGFRNPPDGSDMAAFNTAMSKVRESVEWGFCNITRNWPFLSCKRR